jgi:hypothetical protein
MSASTAVRQGRYHGTDDAIGRTDAGVLDAPIAIRSPVTDDMETFVEKTSLTNSQALAGGIGHVLQCNGN